MDTNHIKYNINKVKQAIDENRKEHQEVDLIVVTKYVTSDVIRQLYELGLRKFGENRTDDLLKKQEELADINAEIEWHFVGRLQTRPVRKMINEIAVLHSLDRYSLIKEVDKRAKKPISCFLQVNISGEEQKAGFTPDEVLDLLENLKDFPQIHIIGLMTMTPYEGQEDALRKYFSEMSRLQDKIQSLNLPHAPCTELSMGMSSDFAIAIQEGATVVRVGRAILKD